MKPQIKQGTLAMMSGFERYTKKTRRAAFLEEMERVVPWRKFCALIEPHYSKPGNGRPPVGIERMLRIYFLQKLREDLQSRSYLTQSYFGRAVPIIVRSRSTSKRGREELYTPLSFNLSMSGDLAYVGPDGQKMHLGFVRLRDLHTMFVAMKERFLDRNIRFLLSGRKPGQETAVNRRLLKAFEEIIITKKVDPAEFAFNHNGVTLFAEMIEGSDGNFIRSRSLAFSMERRLSVLLTRSLTPIRTLRFWRKLRAGLMR